MAMKSRKFLSPRDEALDIALKTRDAILSPNPDVVSVLRSCLVISSILRKSKDEDWVESELRGYSSDSKLPGYRRVSCKYARQDELQDGFRDFNITKGIYTLVARIKTGKILRIDMGRGVKTLLDPMKLERIVGRITDRCLRFLNGAVSELQYGGIVEYLMEEIRNNVDDKLLKLDKSISDEASSIYTNLPSNNPADWSKVAHSCRRILIFVADKLFRPESEQYKMKDGSMIEVGEKNYINRLSAFVDQESKGDQQKFVVAEANYLKDYLRQVLEPIQKGEHNKSTEKLDAEAIAIHTYLILSEVLKLTRGGIETDKV